MEDLFIRNTSGDLLGIIKTDLEKLKKVNEMYEALEWLIDNNNDDNLIICSTAMNDEFTDIILIDKLLEITSLLKSIKS